MISMPCKLVDAQASDYVLGMVVAIEKNGWVHIGCAIEEEGVDLKKKATQVALGMADPYYSPTISINPIDRMVIVARVLKHFKTIPYERVCEYLP